MSKFTIGIDFGTMSARALVVEVESGNELAVAEYNYPHAVMDTFFYDEETKLPEGWALQHPQDYVDALRTTVPETIKKSGVSVENIIGVGVDFTSCTMMPVDEHFIPLCFDEKYKNEPHAYVKLWKHHAAQFEADKISKTAKENGYNTLLQRFGGRVSSEYLLPKYGRY